MTTEESPSKDKPKEQEPKGDLSLLSFGRPDPYLHRVLREAAAAIPPNPVPKVKDAEDVTDGVDDDVGSGSPTVHLGAAPLAVLLDYLVMAENYMREGDFEEAFPYLDSFWDLCPSKVSIHFPRRPSDELNRRIRDFERFPFEKYPIYQTWMNRSEKVSTRRYLQAEYLQYDSRKFYEERWWHIANETAAWFVRAFVDTMEKEGYHLPVSGRYRVDQALRDSRMFDAETEGGEVDG